MGPVAHQSMRQAIHCFGRSYPVFEVQMLVDSGVVIEMVRIVGHSAACHD